MIKKSIIAMTACALLSSGIANAQIYNESASSRQSASSDLGMYQLTLAAFRASNFFNGYSQASQFIRKQVDKTKFGGEACITVNSNGFPTPVMNENSRRLKTYSYWVGQELIDASYAQRDVYISLSIIAANSFPAIKKANMNRSQATKYLSQQIDKELLGLLKKNDYEGGTNISTNVSGGGTGWCLGDTKSYSNRPAINEKYQIEYAENTSSSSDMKSSNDFIRDYSSNFDDGFVLKSSSGSPDLSYRGQPWFSESGIQGQKLSIGSSSEKGSNTSQKRGE